MINSTDFERRAVAPMLAKGFHDGMMSLLMRAASLVIHDVDKTTRLAFSKIPGSKRTENFTFCSLKVIKFIKLTN
jgi:hypothetical protein